MELIPVNPKKSTLMKKILGFAVAFVTLLCGGCTSDDEVRVMPEFSYSDRTVTLGRAEGSSFTALIATTEPVVEAEFDCEWLSVDVNRRRAVFTATQTNETSETRTAQVTLRAGEFVEQVTVNQSAVEEEGGLKVGDLTDDGLGMIFWVDPSDKTIGKAVSLARLEGKPFELTMKAHGAESRVDGLANTALYTEHTAEEAAGYCTAMGEGWYLPAVNELNELFDAYNGVGHEDPSFVAATIETLTDPEKMARAAFDKMLTDLGGTVIDATTSGNGQSYWSSTEYDEKNAYGVRVGKYAQDKWDKSKSGRFVRCVRRVGNYLPPEEPATLTLSAQTLALEAAAGSTASVTATTNKELSTLAVTLADASWLAFEIADATITFRALSANETGDARSTTATVTAGSGDNTASVTLTLSQAKLITVEPWKVGDIVPDAEGLKGGIVFWVDPSDGTKAKIVSFDRGANIPWGATDVRFDLSDTDGAVNSAKIAAHEQAATCTALAWCTARGEGWYLPSRQDLIDLFDFYNGCHNGEGFTNKTPDQISDAEKAQRDKIEKLFLDAGGDPINGTPEACGSQATGNGNSYWASNEKGSGTDEAHYVLFGKLNVSGTTGKKNSTARFIRAMRVVEKTN